MSVAKHKTREPVTMTREDSAKVRKEAKKRRLTFSKLINYVLRDSGII